jgi:hypothetical protein
MTETLTEHQIADLIFMGTPQEWPYNPLLQMKHYHQGEQDKDFEPGTLVYIYQAHTYMFYPGVSVHMPPREIERLMAEVDVKGPMLAPQIEDLVREGWEVD